MSKRKNRKSQKPAPKRPELEPATDGKDALARLATSEKNAHPWWRFGARLRNYFLTGLIIVGPVSITLYIASWFINAVDAWVKPYVPDRYNPETYLPISLPGVGLIFGILLLMVIGALAANLFGRTLISYGEGVVGRMPVVRNFYRALKQIFETVLSQSGSSFQKVALVEYPRRGLWAIVFISTDTTGEIDVKSPASESMVSVFLPTTPNPTSGYLLFVPKSDVIVLDMTVEEAAKMVISAGLVTPEYQGELAQLAAKKRKPSDPLDNSGSADNDVGDVRIPAE